MASDGRRVNTNKNSTSTDGHGQPPLQAGDFDPADVDYIGGLLTDEMVRRLGRIDAERARLPLALAILERIRRLWRTIFGQRYLVARFTGDELLYQKLRKSLFAQLDHEASWSKMRKLARETLPEMLLTSDELTYWDAEIYTLYDSQFQQLEVALIQLSLSLDIEPDTRGVAALLVTHDDYLDTLERVANHEYERALRQFGFHPNETAGEHTVTTTTERVVKEPQPHEYKDLALALEAIDRVESVWTMLYGDLSVLRRYPGDESVYQSYRSAVIKALKHDSRYVDGLSSARKLLPRTLPTSSNLHAMRAGSDVTLDALQELRGELIALAYELNEPIELDYPADGGFDVALGDEIERNYRQLCKRLQQDSVTRKQHHKSHAAAAPDQHVAETDATSSSGRTDCRPRTGRKSVSLSYKTAQRVWWEMLDEYEPERPSQADFCTRLSGIGFPMSDRTLRVRIAEWREQNRFWPPPRPEI